jgi:hypothetical protein
MEWEGACGEIQKNKLSMENVREGKEIWRMIANVF